MSKVYGAVSGSLLIIANLSTALSQWVLVLLLAILGGTGEVGTYSLALAVVTPVFIALDLSLRNVYVTNQVSHRFQEYVSVRFLSGVVGVMASALLGLLIGLDVLLVLLIGLGRFGQAILELAFGFFQKRNEVMPIVGSALSNSALTILLGGSIFWISGSLKLSLVGVLIGTILVVSVTSLTIIKSDQWAGSGRSDGDRWLAIRKIFLRGLPSGLAFASIAVLGYLPMYFLGFYSTSESVGVFTALSYFLTFANIFYNSIQQLTLNDYVRSYQNSGVPGLRSLARKMLVQLVCAGLLSAVAFQLLGTWVIELVYGAEFVPPPEAISLTAVTLLLLPPIYVVGASMLTMNMYGRQFQVGVLSLLGAGLAGLAVNEGIDLASAALIALIGNGLRLLIAMFIVWPHLFRSKVTVE